MLDIRPVSDLRNHFKDIEESVSVSGRPVFLTKNGYGSMVVMSVETYSELARNLTYPNHAITELQLDHLLHEAEDSATNSMKLSDEEVFARAKARIHAASAL